MAEYKVTVDKDLCIGCGACEQTCNNFKLVGSKAHVIEEIVSNVGCNADAEEGCPVSAISVEKI